MAPIAPVVSTWAVRFLAKLHLCSLKTHLHYRRKKWNGSDKKWNGSAKSNFISSVRNRLRSFSGTDRIKIGSVRTSQFPFPRVKARSVLSSFSEPAVVLYRGVCYNACSWWLPHLPGVSHLNVKRP